MGTLIISRSGQIRLPLHDRKRDFPARFLTQVKKTCGQAFDRVDIDHLRNQIKHLPIIRWLLAGRENTIAFRKLVHEEATIRDRLFLPIFEAENQRRRVFRRLYLPTAKPEEIRAYTRFEKLGLIAFALVAVSTATNALAPNAVRSVVVDLETEVAAQSPTAAKVLGPINWTTGKASLKGNPKAVMGAFNYAQAANYPFAANNAERDALIANGTLVHLDSKYIRLNNATSPYVLPVVARFVDRLGMQYMAAGCGSLIINGGMRPLDFHGKLKNGSRKSVHPTGMAVDLFRDVDESSFCYRWLEKRLLTIEADRRIDATAENRDRHFHVVVVPYAYEAWLAKLPKGLDPEVKFLALGLYFETAGNETRDGWRAIGWAIRNRVRSSEFPNTYVGVVAEGSAGRKAGGCQFSFMCDGKAEKIETLCAKPDALMAKNWLNRCDEKWATAVEFAKQILAEPESADPTGGAVLYYATWMKPAPDWVGDMRKVKTIGSHTFGCSTKRGDDACRS